MGNMTTEINKKQYLKLAELHEYIKDSFEELYLAEVPAFAIVGVLTKAVFDIQRTMEERQNKND